MSKPVLCVDFDGVIHSYSSGWKGADVVSDDAVPGAMQWLRSALERFTVCIYSSRTSQPGGITAMRQAIGRWSVDQRSSDHEDLSWLGELQFPEQKPAAFLTLDDRAVCFTGTWPSVDDLAAFKPWNKRT